MPESQVMSSKDLLEPCGDSEAEDVGRGTRQGKGEGKEEKEVGCRSGQPAGGQMQVELGAERPPSSDCGGKEEVSPEGGMEQAQVEETQSCGEKTRVSHLSAHQVSQPEEPVACTMKRRHRRPKLRDKVSCRNRETRRYGEEHRGPFYFFGGTNGAEIVSKYCESKGWRRIYDKQREDFKLKWCETKSPADYSSFREGEQLLYQIPNNKVLTTKIGLLSSLREYERVTSKVSHGQRLRSLKMEEFIPTTFRMDVREERETFFSQQEGVSNNESRMWICKPTGLNQGRGIFLLSSQEDIAAFRLKLQHMEDHQGNRRVHHRRPQAHIVQHYIQNPLLLQGKKFDVRSYLLIACTAPYMVFFRHGYVRLTCDLYDPKSNNLSAHLTNQYMQKKNPLYSQLKEDTVWSMESFNAYVNDRFQVAMGLPRDWVLGTFAKRMQQIMTQSFFAVKSKLVCRPGLFDLIGCDFMVDEDFKVWLLEMNCNPALHTNCEALKEVIPSTVTETLDLTLEIFNKCRLRQKIFPLASQREFVLLYNGSLNTNSVLAYRKSDTHAELNQKPKKAEPSRCKSATEGKSVTLPSPDNPVSVSASYEGMSPSESGLHPTTMTSTSSLAKENSRFYSCKSTESVRNRNTRPRVELTLSKCTLHHHLKAADVAKHPGTQQKMRILMSLSSPAFSKQSFICRSPETRFPAEEIKEDTKSSACETKEEV